MNKHQKLSGHYVRSPTRNFAHYCSFVVIFFSYIVFCFSKGRGEGEGGKRENCLRLRRGEFISDCVASTLRQLLCLFNKPAPSMPSASSCPVRSSWFCSVWSVFEERVREPKGGGGKCFILASRFESPLLGCPRARVLPRPSRERFQTLRLDQSNGGARKVFEMDLTHAPSITLHMHFFFFWFVFCFFVWEGGVICLFNFDYFGLVQGVSSRWKKGNRKRKSVCRVYGCGGGCGDAQTSSGSSFRTVHPSDGPDQRWSTGNIAIICYDGRVF